jgi:hypothetical protein
MIRLRDIYHNWNSMSHSYCSSGSLRPSCKLTIEKTNGQSRETGKHRVHKTQEEDKQNKKHNTKLTMSDTNHTITGMNPGAIEGQFLPPTKQPPCHLYSQYV